MSYFEAAAQMKLRFNTDQGMLSCEDLWDMPLTILDGIAKILNRAVKAEAEESFIATKSKKNAVLDLQFNIVKRVIEVKLEARETNKNMAATKQQKEKLLGLIADKQDEAMKDLSVDDLKKMVADL